MIIGLGLFFTLLGLALIFTLAICVWIVINRDMPSIRGIRFLSPQAPKCQSVSSLTLLDGNSIIMEVLLIDRNWMRIIINVRIPIWY
jgi:hypothetical protein